MTDKRKKFLKKLHDSRRAPYGTWKCNICHKIFKSRALLKEHKCIDHNYIHAIVHGNKYICPYCKREFNTNAGYASHSNRCKSNPAYNESLVKLRYKKQGETLSKKIISGDVIPGFKGKKHTKNTRERISMARSINLSTDIKSGRRKDVKWYKVKNLVGEEYIVRGHWEEKVAYKLNELNILWTKNKQIPYFDGDITRRYNPDFYLPNQNAYIEVKGYFPPEDKHKMELVIQQHPTLVIFFIGSNEYKDFLNGNIKLNECRFS